MQLFCFDFNNEHKYLDDQAIIENDQATSSLTTCYIFKILVNKRPKTYEGGIVMILNETYTLPNGVEIPRLGLGTWFISDADAAQAVTEAAKIGYRHVDTAQAYENEKGVGEGIRICGMKREEMFVTTKLAAEVKSYNEAVSSIDESLKKLGLDYIDMMIIHSPRPWMEYHETEPYYKGNQEAWKALEEAYEAGKLRAIGVSNTERPACFPYTGEN